MHVLHAIILLMAVGQIVFLSAIGASAQCGITKHPVSKTVQLERTVELRCATENGAEVIDWLHGEDSISVNNIDGAELTGEGTLFIDVFDKDYAGLWRCVVDNKEGRCVSKAATLFYNNTQNEFQTHPQDFVVYTSTNKPAVYNCTYTESEYLVPPTIHWETEDGTRLSSDDPDSISIISYRYTSFLQIHTPLSYDNLTRFRCIVTGGPGNSEYSNFATLIISEQEEPRDQPSFSSFPFETMYLNKGETVIAGCTDDGPTDSIPLTWAFEDYTEFFYEGIGLLIPDLPVSFYGPSNLLVNSSIDHNFHNDTYVCQILVNSGREFLRKPVTFFVYDNPVVEADGLENGSSFTVNKKEGENTDFMLVVNKDTPSIVKWFHNGKPLKSSANRHITIRNDDSEEFDYTQVWTQDLDASVSVSNITCDDAGFYQVEISNPAMTRLFSYFLNVECTITPAPIGPQADDNDDDSFPWWIIILIILLLLLLLILILICCWCWRRRYVVYEAEKLENQYHKEYEAMRGGGSPEDSIV